MASENMPTSGAPSKTDSRTFNFVFAASWGLIIVTMAISFMYLLMCLVTETDAVLWTLVIPISVICLHVVLIVYGHNKGLIKRKSRI